VLDSDLRRLSELVLAPVANLLTKKRVLVAADGALQYVPFAVLQMPSADEGPSTRLLSSHEVLEIPSVSALVSLRSVGARRMPTKQVAVFADPVFERTDSRLEQTQLVSSAATPEPTLTRAAQRSGSMTRLPLTALEASAIGNLVPQDERLIVLGFDANRETVLRTDLSDYRIVHFATHGLIDARYPDLSALVLSRFDPSGASRNGLLELHDIYELKLNADLVVLSACETALGRAVHGEGLIGLTQGFLYAGARSVLAALWPVPDRATAEFMGRFYQYMLTERLSPPEALRRAQLSLAAESRWRSPYFWGAFVLVGDWKAS
jgi:CHAT domain-containing protein